MVALFLNFLPETNHSLSQARDRQKGTSKHVVWSTIFDRYIVGVPSMTDLPQPVSVIIPNVTICDLDQGWADERRPPPGSAPIKSSEQLSRAEATAIAAISRCETCPLFSASFLDGNR